MTSFPDLSSLYAYLEQIDITVSEFQIGAHFMQLRVCLIEQGSNEDARKAQVEIDIFNFQINQGEVKPLTWGKNPDGTEFSYPSFSRFTDADSDYLRSRLQSTNNLLLSARYGHILWKWKRGERDSWAWAQRATEAYLELSKKYAELSRSLPESTWGVSFLHAIENCFALSLELNYETVRDKVKSEILQIVSSYPVDISSSFLIHLKLVDLMLRKSLFKATDFSNIQEKLWRVALRAESVHQFVQLCLIGEKVGEKTGNQLKNWQEEIGKKFEQEMTAQMGKNNFFEIENCEDAIKAYRKARNDQKVAELTLVYDKLKRNIVLTPFPQELNLTEYEKWCEEKANELSKSDFTAIINVLMWDKSLLPDIGEVEQRAKEKKDMSRISNLFPLVVLDSNGNKAQYFSTEEEKLKFSVLEQYGNEIERRCILIDALLSKAIEAEALNFQSLYGFLKRDSWIGQPIQKGYKSGEVAQHIWLDLVSPALKSFFEEFQKPRDSAQFILFIDSLVPKLEGMIRDICFLVEIPIFTFDQGNRSRERYIHELLYEEKLKSTCGENDLFFFKFLFIEKSGYNLRNKVAHGLMAAREYSRTLCYLILLSFLRLSKFQLSDSPIQYDDNIFTETDKDSS